MAEPIPLNTIEDENLEDLPPITNAEEVKEPTQREKDAKNGSSDVETDPVPPEVPRSASEEDGAEPNDEPADEQRLTNEPSSERAGNVDHADDAEYADEGAFEESGLEIPGVWCAHTGKDRTDTTHRNRLRSVRLLRLE